VASRRHKSEQHKTGRDEGESRKLSKVLEGTRSSQERLPPKIQNNMIELIDESESVCFG
jgi:hypothetical protein